MNKSYRTRWALTVLREDGWPEELNMTRGRLLRPERIVLARWDDGTLRLRVYGDKITLLPLPAKGSEARITYHPWDTAPDWAQAVVNSVMDEMVAA